MQTRTQIQLKLERLKINIKDLEAFLLLPTTKKHSDDYEFALIDLSALREREKMLRWVLEIR